MILFRFFSKPQYFVSDLGLKSNLITFFASSMRPNSSLTHSSRSHISVEAATSDRHDSSARVGDEQVI